MNQSEWVKRQTVLDDIEEMRSLFDSQEMRREHIPPEICVILRATWNQPGSGAEKASGILCEHDFSDVLKQDVVFLNDCIPVLLNMDVLAFSAACRILADERPFEAEPTTENLLKDKVYHYVHLLDVLKMEVEKAIYSDALRICKEYREWQTIVKTMDFFSWAERAGFYIPSAVEEWLNRNPENEREKHAAEWRELSKELKGKKKKKVALIAAEKCLGLSHQEAFRSALPDASFSNAKDYCQKNRKIAEELAKLYGMHMPDWNSES